MLTQECAETTTKLIFAGLPMFKLTGDVWLSLNLHIAFQENVDDGQ